jgi:succinyl-CoA synthetase alpha subunit
MSVLIGRETRLVVQGITGREGEFHSLAMQAYGTNIVAGMTPGKGGQTALDGTVPVFDTVEAAVRETGANTSCIFVPAPGAPDAVLEAVGAGIKTIFCITEGIPVLDMIPVVEEVRLAGAHLIGPNCPGATSASFPDPSIARAGSAWYRAPAPSPMKPSRP